MSRIYQLANNKISIWVYQTSNDENKASLMHDKFCIFEDNILHKTIIWTGSYNFTRRASFANQENILILDIPEIVERFCKQFEILKTRSLLISGNSDSYKTINQQMEKPCWWEPFIAWLGL